MLEPSLRDHSILYGFLAHRSLSLLRWPVLHDFLLLDSDNTSSLFVCKIKGGVSSVASHILWTLIIRVFFLQFGPFPIVLNILVSCLLPHWCRHLKPIYKSWQLRRSWLNQRCIFRQAQVSTLLGVYFFTLPPPYPLAMPIKSLIFLSRPLT